MRNKSKLQLAVQTANHPKNHKRVSYTNNPKGSNRNPQSNYSKSTTNSHTKSQVITKSSTVTKSRPNVAPSVNVPKSNMTATAPLKSPTVIIDNDKPVKQPSVTTSKPKRRLTNNTSGGHSHSHSSKGKKESADKSLFTRVVTGSNERSETYRRDFIKANPPFLGKWYLCSLCNKIIRVEDMQVDHIFPVSKGGSNKTYNLAPLCAPCNRDKSNKVDSRFVQMYIRKFGGKAIGVPVSIAFGAVTFTGKWGIKGGLWIGKNALALGLKGLAAGITMFLGAGIKIQALVVLVILFLLFKQGIISF